MATKKKSIAFDFFANTVKKDNKQFIKKNLDVSEEVRLILSRHATIKNQKDLAKSLGKSPSEISRWLSGICNITLDSITKMETALGEDIIMTSSQFRKKSLKSAVDIYVVIESKKSESTIRRHMLPKGQNPYFFDYRSYSNFANTNSDTN